MKISLFVPSDLLKKDPSIDVFLNKIEKIALLAFQGLKETLVQIPSTLLLFKTSHPLYFFGSIICTIAIISVIFSKFFEEKISEKKEVIRIESLGLLAQNPVALIDRERQSPTLAVPFGIKNTANNSFMNSCIQIILHSRAFLGFVNSALSQISTHEKYNENPFLNYEFKLEINGIPKPITKKIKESLIQEPEIIKLKQKIEKSKEKSRSFFDHPIELWGLYDPNELEFFFNISIQNAALFTLYILEKIQNKQEIKFEENKLLRLCLCKLIHQKLYIKKNQRTEASGFASSIYSFELPGVNYGLKIYSEVQEDPVEFLLSLISSLDKLTEKSIPKEFLSAIHETNKTFQADGEFLGLLLEEEKDEITCDFLKLDVTRSDKQTPNLDIQALFKPSSTSFESRGIFNEDSGFFFPHSFDEAEALKHETFDSESMNLKHAQIARKRGFKDEFFIQINPFDTSSKLDETKLFPYVITLPKNKENSNFFLEAECENLEIKNYELSSIIAHVGKTKETGHILSIVSSLHHGKRYFFKIDDEEVVPFSFEELSQLLKGNLTDPIWGPVSPVLLSFQKGS